ncbi:hypothetical protein ACHAWF_006262 [Thalassiosira exigua]
MTSQVFHSLTGSGGSAQKAQSAPSHDAHPEQYHRSVPDSGEHRPPSPRSIDDFLESAYSGRGATTGRRPRWGDALRDVLRHWQFYVIFLALGIANSGDSAEMGCTSYILSSVKFQRDILGAGDGGGGEGEGGADFAGRGSAIAGAHFGGMLFSGLLSGVLADVWGRRSTLLVGLANNAVVGVLSAGARNATELCMLRFMCGIGLGMVIAGVVPLAAEMAPPSKRGRFMTLVGSCYTLGFLYTAFWALVIFRESGSGSWRLFMFINALPTMIAASLVALFVPESPRFFLSQGKLHEAVHVANLLASRIGFVEKSLTEDELTEYLFRTKRLGRASCRGRDAIQLNEGARSFTEERQSNLFREVWLSIASIKQVFSGGMYRLTIPLQMTYFFLTLVTGVSTWWTKIFQNLHLQTDAYALSFAHTLSQIPGMMLASGLIDWVGRRRLVIIGFGGGFLSLLLLSSLANTIAASGGELYYSVVVLALACIYTMCLCISWLALDCLSAESYPTKIRSTGRSVLSSTGRLAGLGGQFLFGPLINDDKLSFMLGLASLFAVFGVAVSFKTTDTTNLDLQDHWDYSESEDVSNTGSRDRYESVRGTSFVETPHSKYLSIEQNL